jgi:hypothetical protein
LYSQVVYLRFSVCFVNVMLADVRALFQYYFTMFKVSAVSSTRWDKVTSRIARTLQTIIKHSLTIAASVARKFVFHRVRMILLFRFGCAKIKSEICLEVKHGLSSLLSAMLISHTSHIFFFIFTSNHDLLQSLTVCHRCSQFEITICYSPQWTGAISII